MAIQNTYTCLYGRKLHETEKAVHFQVLRIGMPTASPAFNEGEPDKFWFPLSQISAQTFDPARVEEDMVKVADWLLIKAGLISSDSLDA